MCVCSFLIIIKQMCAMVVTMPTPNKLEVVNIICFPINLKP